MAYIYTYKFTYIVLAERGVLDDPPLAMGLVTTKAPLGGCGVS